MADPDACLRCGMVPGEKDTYCTSCGAPLQNKCMDIGGPFHDPCGHTNDRHASFCAKCGEHTAFYKAGLLTTQHSPNQVLRKDPLRSMDWFDHPFFQGDD